MAKPDDHSLLEARRRLIKDQYDWGRRPWRGSVYDLARRKLRPTWRERLGQTLLACFGLTFFAAFAVPALYAVFRALAG